MATRARSFSSKLHRKKTALVHIHKRRKSTAKQRHLFTSNDITILTIKMWLKKKSRSRRLLRSLKEVEERKKENLPGVGLSLHICQRTELLFQPLTQLSSLQTRTNTKPLVTIIICTTLTYMLRQKMKIFKNKNAGHCTSTFRIITCKKMLCV